MHPSQTYILFFALLDLGMALTFITYVPFLLTLRLDLADVAMINVWFWASVLIGEIPTGIFADRVSRGLAVWLGTALIALGALLYAGAVGFKTALTYEMLIGFGSSWISGAAGAWIRDALTRRGEDAKYTRVIGTTAIARACSVLIGGILGAVFGASFGYRAVWLVSGAVLFCAFLVSFVWMGAEGDAIHHERTDRKLFAASVTALRSVPGLQWITAASIAFGLVLPFNHYWTPYFIPLVGEKRMYLLWCLMYSCLACAGYLIRRYPLRKGKEGAGVVIAIFCAGIGLTCISLPRALWMSIAATGIHEIGRGFFAPLVEIFTQRRIESHYRATYVSLQSLLTKVGYVFVLIGVWWWMRGLPTNNASISSVWRGTGGVLLFSTLLLWFFRPREGKNR